MTLWDIEGLIRDRINKDSFQSSISDAPATELVEIYEDLFGLVNKYLGYPNIPEIAMILSDLQHAYGLEIANRYLFSHEGKPLEIPDKCLPADLRDC